MYYGEQPRPIQLPSTDSDWSELFDKLSGPVVANSTDEIVSSYKQGTKEWWKPIRSDVDKEGAEQLLGFIRACIISAYDDLMQRIDGKLGADLAPELVGIIPQYKCASVRETQDGKEYSLLIQLRDVHGRSLALFENGMSIPTNSAVMMEILAGADASKARFIIRSSKDAFIEDIDHAQKMIDILGAEALNAEFRPTLFRTIRQLLINKYGEDGNNPAFVEEISIQKVENDPKLAIVHMKTACGHCLAEIHYKEESCTIGGTLRSVPDENDWNRNNLGE